MEDKNESGPKFNVLVVEDNFINQELMREMLDRLHCAVDTAENGQVALNQLKANKSKYHMIFMDLHMPEMDGFEATRQIRESECDESIPIVALTANVTSGVERQCLESGMDAYLQKPFDIQDIENLLKKYCSG